MTSLARTLAALALTLAATLGPIASPASGGGENLAEDVRAFRAEKLREIDEATAELRDLIAEKARSLAAMEADLRDAEAELGHLEAFKASFESPAPLASTPPAIIPGTLDAVIPASAIETTGSEWRGTIRIASSDDGKLAIVHESIDSSGDVGGGASQGDLIEIRVSSLDDARVIAAALRADGNPVVTWPFRNIGIGRPASNVPDDRIDALDRTIERLTEAVDRIDRRTSSSAPEFDEAPGPLPPAPIVPD